MQFHMVPELERVIRPRVGVVRWWETLGLVSPNPVRQEFFLKICKSDSKGRTNHVFSHLLSLVPKYSILRMNLATDENYVIIPLR